MFRVSLFLIILFIHVLGIGQVDGIKEGKGGVYRGTVLDSKIKIPLEYVAIRLFSKTDSTVVAGIYTDKDGRFDLQDIPFGEYYVKYTFSGYETNTVSGLTFSKQEKTIDAGIIFLGLDAQLNLEEVKVTGKLDMLKIGIDKKVYNIGEDLSIKGGSVNDALNNIPSIQVDNDGNISLRGDGNVTILIDGRPSNLTGGGSKSLLESIPASSIERIEIVTNPSAKYDPDGTSGIINIVLKKNKLMGFNGFLSATGATGYLYNGNASLSYRNSKLNTYANYSRNYTEGYRNYYGTIAQTLSDGTYSRLEQNREGTDQNSTHNGTFGTDLYLSKSHTLGFSLTAATSERTRKGDLLNELYDGNNQPTRIWLRTTDDPTLQDNLDANLNYKFDFKEEKGNLQINFSQSNGWEENTGTYVEQSYNLDNTPSSEPSIEQTSENNITNLIRTSQVDYRRIFPGMNAYVETGAKGIFRDQGVNSLFIEPDTSMMSINKRTHHSVDFDYHEENISGYGIFGHQLDKLKYQVGFRVESFLQNIDQRSGAIEFDNNSPSEGKVVEQKGFFDNTENTVRNNYFNFYPSGHVKYGLNEKSELSFGYSRRINRPSPHQVSPFSNFADPYNLRFGNPNLKPEFIHSLDLGYSIEKKKVSITSNVYYKQTSDVIQRIKFFYDDNTSAVTYANIDRSNDLGVEIVFVYKPTKWWRNIISTNGNFIQYTDNSSEMNLNRGGANWSVKYVGSIDSWNKTLTTQINAQYNAPRVTAQGRIQPRASIDVSSEKKLKDGKWTVGMRVTDIFNTRGFIFSLDQPTVSQDAEYKWLTRRFFVTVSYKFGKFTSSDKQKGYQDGGGGDF